MKIKILVKNYSKYVLLITVFVLTSNLSSQTAGEIKDTVEQEISAVALPFGLYSEILGWAAGGFVGIQGLSQRNMSIYMGGLLSTNGTKYGFLQFREFYLPFYPRIYIAPDILGGYFGVLNVYKDPPGTPPPGDPKYRAGSNESDKDNYMEVSGYDQWYELKFRYLLPIGHGNNNVYFTPVLENGILKSGEMGGTDWNPFISGRTFIDIKPFYRKRVAFATNGIDFALTRENTDFYVNPTKGSFQKVAFRRDFGWFDTMAPWSVVETDLRWYLPLHEFLFDKSSLPKVLAFDFWTINTLTWNSYDIVGIDPEGNEIKKYHRPPPYTGAYLGGRYRLRAFYEGRFNDRAAIYYGMEYRQIIKWNPFDLWTVTKKLNVHWLQLAAFFEVGRVAPEWNISTLHTDMKWSAGGGLRIFMNNLILRIESAFSEEGNFIQMYVDHAF
ncbi:MAG TPA: BamA/TamA family outer membrane protein [Ignavibacteriaceae bacterium]|nr:BamA/TamA family outer membrane protein [Ignavibacteriaceae bacterium]